MSSNEKKKSSKIHVSIEAKGVFLERQKDGQLDSWSGEPMNFIDAVKSGHPFRRKSWETGNLVVHKQLNFIVWEDDFKLEVVLSRQDVIADDWEIVKNQSERRIAWICYDKSRADCGQLRFTRESVDLEEGFERIPWLDEPEETTCSTD